MKLTLYLDIINLTCAREKGPAECFRKKTILGIVKGLNI